MKNHIARMTFPAAGLAVIAMVAWFAAVGLGQQPTPPAQNGVVGQSVTRLSDGRWLVVGGMGSSGPVREIVVVEGVPDAEPVARVKGSLSDGRGWHAATILPDGQVLITGGFGQNGEVLTSAEVFDPSTGVLRGIPWFGAARAHHAATLLRDGRVLLTGGVSSARTPVATVEAFDPETFEVRALDGSLIEGRKDHTATLLPNGTVRLDGGLTPDRDRASTSEIYNPILQSSRRAERPEREVDVATLAFSSPANGEEASSTTPIALQFTKPLAAQSLKDAAIQLQGESDSITPVRTVLAEGGRLLFIIPDNRLVAGERYHLTARRLFDTSRVWAADVSLTLRIKPEEHATAEDSEEWIPPANRKWRADRAKSPWESLAPLRAANGVTAVSGRVILLNGHPLAGVTLRVGEKSAVTDRTGRFLVTDVAAGSQTIVIDGRSANRDGRTYGVFLSHLEAKPGETTVLPYTIWMPRIDTAHAVQISSPLGADLVVTTPLIPGLEVIIPKGSVIRDHDGRPVSQVSITPIPVDRTPFPLPTGVDVPVYFTIQPGGGFIETPHAPWPSGAGVVYPNFTGERPGTDFQFWNYDPEDREWHVYGQGTVNSSGAQVVPRPGVVIYRFTGTMINIPGITPPPDGPLFGGPRGGDPVDLATGLFVLEKTDLYLPDVMPVSLTRTYRQNDSASRPFGRGATHPYAMFLWSAQSYQEADLILPDGGRIHYVRTSPGTGFIDAAFEHTTSPGPFYKSTITYIGNGPAWHLKLKDGTTYIFGLNDPLEAIRDRHGNTITIEHTGANEDNVTKVRSQNGRFIEFTYDASNRVTQAKDNIGRTVGYEYDGSGRLWKVTDPANGVTEYTYDASHRMLTIKDARGLTFLTNQYDTNGRVTLQTQTDSTTYQFAYTLDGSGRVTQNDVTDPRGNVTRWTFNTSKYPTSRIEAFGTAHARTTTWTRDTGTHRVTRVTDGLSRNTDFTYDSLGNVATVTRLAGTGAAVTTSFTYEATFNQLASVTDPLSHTTTFTHNATGDVTAITDPLSHQTTLTYNAAGQPLTVTTPAGTASFSYDLSDLVAITDPLSQTTTQFHDSVGRLLRVTNPLGQTIRSEYDALNATTKVIDALGGETTFTYDENGNVLSLTDARSNTTTYTYDNMDRVATRTDPLTRQETYTYDNNGNLSQVTDRKSQVTAYTYDPLDRQTQVTYHDSSTTDYTYDAGDRLTEIDDSIAGVIERDYDLLDRLTDETTPEGSVSYTYDGADRRATMTVVGQTQVSYGYDNADRLTSITQGSAVVGFTYDSANRRTVLTLPNGVTVESAYDAASQVTGLTYKLGASTLGDLTYTYDLAGNRTTVDGSWARTGLPAALASATYDAANRISTWGATSFTYDDNGNLTGDGSKTYTWNSRNELTSLSGGVSASFQYDGEGRRRVKTISGTTTGFLYDGLNAVQELSGGSPSANVLTGLDLDQWFRRTDSATTRDLLTDVLGSTISLADGSGVVQTEYTYGAFGSMTVSGGATTNRSAFTGREDDGTGLIYYRARYQHQTLHRFVSEDPIQFEAGSTNLHAYVENAPTKWGDPLGLIPMRLPPYCNPRKHPNAWMLRCNPLAIGAGPLLGAAAGVAAGWGGAGAGASGAGAGAAAAGAAASAGPTFGHGARHMTEAGISPAAAELAIAEAIRQIQRTSTVVGDFYGKVVVAGQNVIYRAHPVPGRPIHVGTQYVPRAK